ncbi:hypothetical protein A2210_02540 [Candidatus Woesebacteria bacterium RIFOXYA1_FULL_40_18]|uniref:DUF5678 domain-containing protein n=5 Tax=Candidatus Woeseibacteriota TaxID=1752722 RepID=A0A0G0UUX7_9BACT|nr:MAG: hypothetical protein UT72_C0005G0021 [Candidatus Woesebacteria bacterium GW2011_GWB1_40_101]KKR63455.1 MAG: hypothetical protein UU03_C0004G0026 [Candidatus Woesebacteria bacterium GW2011_GWA1_40_45]OGM75613.1 MAG: hypothetical protein A2210_02540 [Candidatus Woesebacteria bacterium RIFOXYA1_FULL_40_18]OGM79854.1 MAG: hypothetical protein A2361_02050 [Candidatus Woesebacteria bacterium RIFOXYB1_FULL_40_26]OGM88219.1 MAG: hypothetical protein A2614_01300 [Candidatus Woesebacteria bacteri
MTKTSKILLPYENKWVALNIKGDKVLAAAKDAKVLSEKLDSLKIGRDEAVMTYVPSFRGWYSPYNV